MMLLRGDCSSFSTREDSRVLRALTISGLHKVTFWECAHDGKDAYVGAPSTARRTSSDASYKDRGTLELGRMKHHLRTRLRRMRRTKVAVSYGTAEEQEMQAGKADPSPPFAKGRRPGSG